MTKFELIKLLNNKFNFNNQEPWDKCGYNFLNDSIVSNVYVCLDITINIVNYCIKNKINTIISHHPLFVDENEILNDNAIIQNNIKINNLLKSNNITHICLHTCYDRYKYGTSYQIYKKINFKNIKSYQWIDNYLLLVNFEKSYKLDKIIKLLKSAKIKNIRYLKEQKNNQITNLVIGAGSCAYAIDHIITNKYDCFLTGDLKWHNYIDAYNNNLNLIDINHNSENVFVIHIKKILTKWNIKAITQMNTINIKQC